MAFLHICDSEEKKKLSYLKSLFEPRRHTDILATNSQILFVKMPIVENGTARLNLKKKTHKLLICLDEARRPITHSTVAKKTPGKKTC